MYQRTISSEVLFEGVGVHSGEIVSALLSPAPAGHGLIFRNTSGGYALANYSNVCDTTLCTKLRLSDGSTIATIEHLMSAIFALGLDNLIITVAGGEMPILDGAAEQFASGLQSVGVLTYLTPRSYVKVLKKVRITDGDRWLEVFPYNGFKATIAAATCGDTVHSATFDAAVDDFAHAIAPARTFSSLKNVQAMQAMGLIKGGSLSNSLVLNHGQPVNEDGFKIDNECARHKILDLIGDLALLGYPIMAGFEGFCIGHAMNNKLVETLMQDKQAFVIECANPQIEYVIPQIECASPQSSGAERASRRNSSSEKKTTNKKTKTNTTNTRRVASHAPKLPLEQESCVAHVV